MVKFLAVLSSLLFAAQIFASTENVLKNGLVKPTVKDPLINEVVSFKPIKDHHFNLEAPQECGKDSTIDPTAKTITCQFHNSGDRKVRLSVCDNAKKYCKQEMIDVLVRNKKSGTPRIKTAPKAETVAMQTKTKKLLMSSFKSMSPSEAIQAASTKKAVLAMVSAEWCPPCNLLKEFLLPTLEFKEATKDLLLVYVDGDSPESDAWKPFLKSRFYPTFVVLNKDLESVALYTSDINENLSNLKKGLDSLSDPYVDLITRVDARISGGFFQKTKDIFNSDESIKADEERLLDYLGSRAKILDQIKYMKAFSKTEYASKILVAEQMAIMFGERTTEDGSDSKLTETEKKIQEESLMRSLLDLSVEENDLYSYHLQKFCSMTQNEKVKKNSKDCLLYSKRLITKLEKVKRTKSEQLKILGEAQKNDSLAGLYKSLGNNKKAESYADLCFQKYQNLYKFSPLKERSRSVRFQQLYCLKNKKDSKKNEFKLLSSLVKDYPFEETFQRKLASYYLKKKDYKKAREYNEKALRYSYGAMWAYNMGTKSDILEGENKKDDALSVLDEALKEVVLDKDGRSSNTIKMLRGKYEALKSALSAKKL